MSYLRLFGVYLRIGVMNELQYRANFLMQLLHSFLSLTTGLLGLAILFSYTNSLRGWNHDELLAVMGVHILVGGLIGMSIQPNMRRLMEEIEEGTLDFTLTKPVEIQFLVSTRETSVWQLVDCIVGAAVLVFAAGELQSEIGPAQALAFASALALGGVMVYSIWLILATGAFWFVHIYNIFELFQSLYQTGRYPVGIYPDWLQMGLTFIVPIAFAVTVPAQALTNRLTLDTFVTATAMALLLFVISHWIWKLGLRRYSGASA